MIHHLRQVSFVNSITALLAASVYVIHGTQIEDGPMVAEARERLG